VKLSNLGNVGLRRARVYSSRRRGSSSNSNSSGSSDISKVLPALYAQFPTPPILSTKKTRTKQKKVSTTLHVSGCDHQDPNDAELELDPKRSSLRLFESP